MAPPEQNGIDPAEDTTLAVLAGGEGSRMGRAKGLLLIHDRPILEFMLERWRWPGPTILVTAPGREHPPGWEKFAQEVSDPVAGSGPLRGLLTALESCETQRVVVTTVDMPGIEARQLVWLIERLQDHPALRALMIRRAVGDPHIEPFPSVYRKGAAELVRRRLGNGLGSVHGLARCEGVLNLPAPQDWTERTWANLNQPEDLAAFERDACQGRSF